MNNSRCPFAYGWYTTVVNCFVPESAHSNLKNLLTYGTPLSVNTCFGISCGIVLLSIKRQTISDVVVSDVGPDLVHFD